MPVLDCLKAHQDEILNYCGHQDWYRLVLLGFHNGKQFEGTIHKYETWSDVEDKDLPDMLRVNRGVRGEGNTEVNRERAARRAKTKIRHACKSAQFDHMLTLTTRDAITDRNVFQKMIEKFIRLMRKKTGDSMQYTLGLEKHDSEKTSEAKRGSFHAHIAVKGRQDYKLLQTTWNHNVCGGRGYVRVSNGTKKMSPGSIASYISKYIGKYTAEADFNKKSYWISHNIAAPVRIIKLFKTRSEAVSWLTDFYDSKGVFWSLDKRHCWQDTELDLFWLPAG